MIRYGARQPVRVRLVSRSDRLFEVIQLLRRAGAPMTAAQMAGSLEVTKRTIYRDVATLQSMRVPIEGEAGIGYVMRPGYDLPPLMFTAEEAEAIVVGLALVGRSADKSLKQAAKGASLKIAEVVPDELDGVETRYLHASEWHSIPQSKIDPALLRRAIREARELDLVYVDAKGAPTRRRIRPLAVVYYIESLVLAAWCALRQDFRHFRIDRIEACVEAGPRFQRHAERLRWEWRQKHPLD